MTMYRTDDPVRDFLSYQRRKDEQLRRYPICEECGEYIQDEKHYVIDGRHYCCECCEEVDTEDYIDEDY